MMNLKTPLKEREIRNLSVGEVVYITGVVVTARDTAHIRMINYLMRGKKMPIEIADLPIYHCGPLVKKIKGEWVILAAGPTTSMRMEPFEDKILSELGARLLIGKGGMGNKTIKAIVAHGAAYLSFTGGAAILAAKSIERVKDVFWLDLGIPDALWVLEVRNFGPLLVTMDSKGGNLYQIINEKARKYKKTILKDP